MHQAENDPAKRRRDRVANLANSLSEMLRQNREGALRYEQSGRFGRLLIRRREPEVFEQYQIVQKVRAINRASQSVQEAKLAAQAEAGDVWVF